MPDLASRSKHEDDLASAIAMVMAQWKNVPFGLIDWNQMQLDLSRAIEAELTEVFVEAADQLLAQFGQVSKSIDTEARQWASRYALVLASQIIQTTRDSLRTAEGEAYLAMVALMFSDVRFYGIGVTEVTRAISAGEGVAGHIYHSATGGEAVGIWHTAEDDRVCIICMPLNGAEPERWEQVAPNGPPAHPRCRCYLDYEERAA